ncbi:hypothetical protein ACFVQ3_14345 [Oerskovia sp. NPDC057915]|uniref:hypothetical protein n=1 Tax=Oerskovia sp. NPDC057915 TaxID=3346280 RepID=UPI0036DA9ADE
MKTFIVVLVPALIAAAAVWILGSYASGLPLAARAAIMAAVVVGAVQGARGLQELWSSRQEDSTEPQ